MWEIRVCLAWQKSPWRHGGFDCSTWKAAAIYYEWSVDVESCCFITKINTLGFFLWTETVTWSGLSEVSARLWSSLLSVIVFGLSKDVCSSWTIRKISPLLRCWSTSVLIVSLILCFWQPPGAFPPGAAPVSSVLRCLITQIISWLKFLLINQPPGGVSVTTTSRAPISDSSQQPPPGAFPPGPGGPVCKTFMFIISLDLRTY